MPVIDTSNTEHTTLATKLLGEKFVSRKDVKAIQYPGNHWRPSDEPFNMADFKAHFNGDLSLGHYIVGTDDMARLFVFDIDLRARTKEKDFERVPEEDRFLPEFDWGEGPQPICPREVFNDENHAARQYMKVKLRSVADGLARRTASTLGCSVAVCDSGGKGLHVYGFTGSRPASEQRTLAEAILLDLGLEPSRGDNFWRTQWDSYCEIEVFPKQDSVGEGGYGNLVRFPLGKHQSTGRWSRFLTTEAPLSEFVQMDTFNALQGDQPWE